MFDFLQILIGCGTAISLFAIYMNYRHKGVGILFGGGRRVRRRDIEDMQRELKALRENLEGMRVDSEKAQEMMADILLSIDDRDRALRIGDPSDRELPSS
ncbi:hypothetical protein HN371_26175 [Candidatus Poribacteria bacterium]|jgi:hypothetical protein|nr:hypothetical protein [Candidatus Poribacteria bacterium]MBT5536932.1 hypothetical protein [Candidatus Poribacteria bacterium]MBT7096372.1 hypothetical protein [Candidatus Poribacteria bacterium]MBT7805659.1 hypothetical protein [Candidatus Poribacteria bacterium]